MENVKNYQEPVEPSKLRAEENRLRNSENQAGKNDREKKEKECCSVCLAVLLVF